MKFVIFDLAGVLVDINSSWQYLQMIFETNNEENFQRYLRREIDYEELLRSEIGKWGKVNIKQIQTILDRLPLRQKALKVIRTLKRNGFETAIISSGISILSNRVKDTLSIDYSYANELVTDEEGWLTGKSTQTVTLLEKSLALKSLLKEKNMSFKQCAVIGDSKFDVPLFKEVGLSIAFNPKDEEVKKAADLVIDSKDLEKILPWLTSKNLIKVNASLMSDTIHEAEALAKSLSPDNLRAIPGLFVRTYNKGKTVKLKIICIRRIETVLATLDDLFECLQLAQRSIKTVAFSESKPF